MRKNYVAPALEALATEPGHRLLLSISDTPADPTVPVDTQQEHMNVGTPMWDSEW